MSKERLEEIKRQFNINKSRLIRLGRNTHVTDDYEWLIEQVERVQELEEANKKNYWIAANFKFENLKLEQQNKRYREVLEFYGNKENYLHELSRLKATNYSKVMDDYGETARKALEESE